MQRLSFAVLLCSLWQWRTAARLIKAVRGAENFWPKRGGAASNSFTTAVAHVNISEPPSWVWQNTLDEMMKWSPLIDADLNIYLQSQERVRKLSQTGEELWTWQLDRTTDGKTTMGGVLHDGSFIVMTNWGHCDKSLANNGSLIALSMESGNLLWRKGIHRCLPLETASLMVVRDVLIYGSNDYKVAGTDFWPTSGPPFRGSGTNVVVGLNVETRDELWAYKTEEFLWDFMPTSTPDGRSLLFSSSCGAAFRIDLFTGEEIWKSGRFLGNSWCGSAGGAMSPDGDVYFASYNVQADQTVALGRIGAFRISDGERLWERAFGLASGETSNLIRGQRELGANQYPSIGPINGRMTVMAGLGGFTNMPTYYSENASMEVNFASYKEYLQNQSWRQATHTGGAIPNEVVALDPETGAVLWRYALPDWYHLASNGDEIGLIWRADRDSWHADSICGPNNQGAPVIAGDGTVYVSDSHRGALYAIKDVNDDGVIAADEVQTFITNNEFLSSPSVAPGMLAAAPCWGNAYIWKEA
mmetsp:Transcript_64928/g.155089  ORF Transcript_64928/g.155089 Transcript_64928/m.155089 type:complete len:528 (-) Transcript_64928:138-1721(-)